MKCVHQNRIHGIAACVLLGLAVMFATVAGAQDEGTQQDQSSQAMAGAEETMRLLHDGLISHDPTLFLSSFNGDEMQGYATFTDQVRTFFNLYENFRVHYQILEVRSTSDDSATVTTNFELQGDNVQNDVPGVTRNGQLNLRLSKGKTGWKITDLQPREFFR